MKEIRKACGASALLYSSAQTGPVNNYGLRVPEEKEFHDPLRRHQRRQGAKI